MAWDAGRKVRAFLNRDHKVMVRVRCGRCRRVLDDVFGGTERPVFRYSEGAIPGRIVANEALRWQCRCGADIPVRLDRFIGAYRAAAARSGRDRTLTLPLTNPPD